MANFSVLMVGWKEQLQLGQATIVAATTTLYDTAVPFVLTVRLRK